MEIWNIATGTRLKLPEKTGRFLPDLGGLSAQALDRLSRDHMIQDDAPPASNQYRQGILGLPFTSLAQALRSDPRPDIMIVGAAVDIGAATRPGARHAPEILRRFSGQIFSGTDAAGRISGVFDPVSGSSPLNGATVFDIGDLFAAPDDPRRPRAAVYSSIETTVDSLMSNSVRPLLVGGDHSVSSPSFLAVSRHIEADLVVFDAHLDADEPEVDTFDRLTHVNFLSQVLNLCPDADIYVLGVREPVGRQRWPLPNRVRCFSVPEGLAYLSGLPTRELYVSVDVDVLDPAFFPATGHPSPGGISVGELLGAIAGLGRRHLIRAADVVEALHSPQHDYTTGLVGGRIVRSLLEAMMQRRVEA